MADVSPDLAQDALSEFRQVQPSQLAVAGVAIAVISMILEFIALSGFAPTVSGDETVGRNKGSRQFDDFFQERMDEKVKERKRIRKKKRLLKALENIQKVEDKEQQFDDDYYNYNYDYDNNDYSGRFFSNEKQNPEQHKIQYQSKYDPYKKYEEKPKTKPILPPLLQKGPPKINTDNVNWPQWNAFLHNRRQMASKSNQIYKGIGQQSNFIYTRPASVIMANPVRVANRRGIQGPRLVPIGRPLRPVRHPKPPVVYGFLRPNPSVPQIRRRYDIIYPYGVGGDSIIDKLARGGNFDNFISAAIVSYVYNRYISNTFSLPTISDVLTTLGIGRRSMGSIDPDLLHMLEKVIQSIEETIDNELLTKRDDDKEQRSAQSTGFISFLQSLDDTLISIRDSFRTNLGENSTAVQFLKDVDQVLVNVSNSNGTTMIVKGLDAIAVEFASAINGTVKRSRRSTPVHGQVGSSRQNAILSFMRVVDESLVEVRKFLEQADDQVSSEEVSSPVIDLMKAVDQGLLKVRQSIANETDTEATEGAIGSLTSVISEGLGMVDHVLAQTVIYSVNNNPQYETAVEATTDAAVQTAADDNPVVSVFKLADQEIRDVKDYFFVDDTGSVDLPGEEDNKNSGFVTVLKLADQEIHDVMTYLATTNDTTQTAQDTTDEHPTTTTDETPVIQVLRLADQEIIDMLKYLSTTETPRSTSTESVPYEDLYVGPEGYDESPFLRFMRRIDREMSEAQSYLYNITDGASNIIGTALTGTDQQQQQQQQQQHQEESPAAVPTQNDIITRLAPIILGSDDNSNQKITNYQPYKLPLIDDSHNGALVAGAVASGVALGGLLGILELITNTGGMLARRYDELGPTTPRRRRRKKRPNRKAQSTADLTTFTLRRVNSTTDEMLVPIEADEEVIDLLQNLKESHEDEYGDYYSSDYNYDNYDYQYQYPAGGGGSSRNTTSRYQYQNNQYPSTNYPDSDLNYPPSNYNYPPSDRQQQYPPSNNEYPPSKYQYPSSPNQYLPPASSQYPPTNNRYPSTSSKNPPTSNNRYPSTGSQYLPINNQYPSTGSQYHPTNNQYASTSGQYPPTSNRYSSTGNQYPSTGSQYPPTNNRYPSTGSQYPPTNTRYPSTSNQYSSTSNRYPATKNQYQPSSTIKDTFNRNYVYPTNTNYYSHSQYPISTNQYPSPNSGNYDPVPGYQTFNKKSGTIGKPGLHQQYPNKDDTLKFSDIYNRDYKYQTYSKPHNTNTDTNTNKDDDNRYIYLDQEDVNKLEFDFDMADEDYKIIPVDFKPLDYEQYEMDEFGNLDFTKPDPTKIPKQKIKKPRRRKIKRRIRHKKGTSDPAKEVLLTQRYGEVYGVPYRRRRYRRINRRPVRHGYFRDVNNGYNIKAGQLLLNQPVRPLISSEIMKRRQEGYAHLNSLTSSIFDFNGLVALAGFWYVWNAYLVGILPTTFLLDFINNFGKKRRKRRKRQNSPEFSEIVDLLHKGQEKYSLAAL